MKPRPLTPQGRAARNERICQDLCRAAVDLNAARVALRQVTGWQGPLQNMLHARWAMQEFHRNLFAKLVDVVVDRTMLPQKGTS